MNAVAVDISDRPTNHLLKYSSFIRNCIVVVVVARLVCLARKSGVKYKYLQNLTFGLLLLLLQRLMPHIYTTMDDSIGGAEGVRAHFVHKG